MKRFLQVTLVEWKLNFRNFLNIFFALVFPLMMLILFGTIYGNEPTAFMGGFGSVDASVPGYICMIIAVSGLMTLPLTLVQYRERKILKRFMVTPVKPIELLLSQLAVNCLTTLVGIIILIAAGIPMFNLHFFGNVFEALFSFFLIMLSVFSLGLFIASIAKNIKAANAISYIVYFPMLFLSGVTIPLVIMPQSMINLSKILPLTYGVQLLKGIWLGGHLSDHIGDIMILGVLTLLFGGLSIRLFKWE